MSCDANLTRTNFRTSTRQVNPSNEPTNEKSTNQKIDQSFISWKTIVPHKKQRLWKDPSGLYWEGYMLYHISRLLWPSLRLSPTLRDTLWWVVEQWSKSALLARVFQSTIRLILDEVESLLPSLRLIMSRLAAQNSPSVLCLDESFWLVCSRTHTRRSL